MFPRRNPAMNVTNLLNPRQRNAVMAINNFVRETRVSFDIEPLNHLLPPRTVTLIPRRLIGDDYPPEILFSFASELRLQVLDSVDLWFRRNNYVLDPTRIQGALMMYNHENVEHTYLDHLSLNDLNGETFINMFERATGNGSNPDLLIRDVDWRFWINPASIQFGGSSNFKNKDELEGISGWDKKLKKIPGYNLADLGCATQALAYGIDLVEKKYLNRFKNNDFTKFNFDLQHQLAFPNPMAVTVLDMQKIVELYPEYRLVILSEVSLVPHIYNGSKYSRNAIANKDKTIFLYLDLKTNHYVTVTGICAFYRSKMKTHSAKVCFECCTCIIQDTKQKCACGDLQGTVRARKRKICDDCGANYSETNKHSCGQTACKFCHLFKNDSDKATHRCPLFVDPKSMDKIFVGDENKFISHPENQPQYELWAWDIESYFVHAKSKDDEPLLQESFAKDENGLYIQENGQLQVTYIRKCEQICNYIYCKNVFTGQEQEFESLEAFLEFACIIQNKGYNYFYAHNSSGYDSRLLFETASKVFNQDITPIMKGSKFMQLKIGKTTFHDSMLHLPGSLKRQGEAFGLKIKKGDFPHGFSTLENVNYIGEIPDVHFFPDRFKTEKERLEFLDWHAGMRKEKYVWNYRTERQSYCRNDVLMLAQVMKISHENTLELFKDYPHLQMSPWFCPTIAGYHHKLQLRHLHCNALKKELSELNADEINEYAQSTWCSLAPEEYYHARLALRGGMTNICKYVHEGAMHYSDIQSSYPNVQMAQENLYPVGSPKIEIHDEYSYPCIFHAKNMDECTHGLKQRIENHEKKWTQKLDIQLMSKVDIEHYCREFTGIITIDIEPPVDLYHPIIHIFDEKRNKVIGPLEKIFKVTVPCVILKRAMDVGYKVTKIYRADRYQLKESKWRNGLLGDMYLAKMKNSGAPAKMHHERISKTFKEKFNIDVGDISKWTKNPTMKATAKILINCGWGKHAESVDHGKSAVFKNDGVDGMLFYEDILQNAFTVKQILGVGEKTLFRYDENRTTVRPNMHTTYLPVAIYVTAYGRLSLWEELIKIDPRGTPKKDLRVIMYDTDSIVYSCSSHNQEYHIPTGDCLGDWEPEDCEINGKGLSKFYSIGPKSYAICPNQGTPYLKLKGAMLDHAHSKMITPETMKDMVINETQLEIPQTSLDYFPGGKMCFRNYRKLIRFNEQDVKGTFNKQDYRSYPFGFISE
jgi:hypothetical protein